MLFYSTAAMAIVAASATKSHSYLPSATFAQLSILGASGLPYLAALYLITESLRFGQTSSDPPYKYSTLLAELATIVRNTCRTPKAGPDAPTFEILTTPSAKQQRAFELLQQIRL
jgi:hypothetical protein